MQMLTGCATETYHSSLLRPFRTALRAPSQSPVTGSRLTICEPLFSTPPPLHFFLTPAPSLYPLLQMVSVCTIVSQQTQGPPCLPLRPTVPSVDDNQGASLALFFCELHTIGPEPPPDPPDPEDTVSNSVYFKWCDSLPHKTLFDFPNNISLKCKTPQQEPKMMWDPTLPTTYLYLWDLSPPYSSRSTLPHVCGQCKYYICICTSFIANSAPLHQLCLPPPPPLCSKSMKHFSLSVVIL